MAGTVKSLTSFFSIPKGDSDLRMVYDASKSWLNSTLWVPSFQFPQSETLTVLFMPGSWMANIDLGEHFHNFPLHPYLQAHCGIDIRPYHVEAGHCTKGRKTKWLHWCRCMMGLKSSPYFTIKATHLAFEVANGDQYDKINSLNWVSVQLNLPGSQTYCLQAGVPRHTKCFPENMPTQPTARGLGRSYCMHGWRKR